MHEFGKVQIEKKDSIIKLAGWTSNIILLQTFVSQTLDKKKDQCLSQK